MNRLASVTLIFGVVAVLAVVPSLAQSGTVDDLASSVVRLVDSVEISAEGDSVRTVTVSGTAFFIRTRDHLYLATAEHVARDMTPSALAVLMGRDGEPDTLALLELVGYALPPTWVLHPESDAALLPLAPAAGTLIGATGVTAVTRSELWAETVPPSRDLPLTILGFPLGMGVETNFSPFSRESKIAGGPVTLRRGDREADCEFFLLQDPSVGGYSGSPVFDAGQPYWQGNVMLVGSGRSRCIGVVHGTVSDGTGGKFAAVVPALRLVELIRQLE